MQKISTIISVLLLATVAANGAINTQVVTEDLQETKEAPKNNNNQYNGQTTRTITPLQNSGSVGNYNSQCNTDWGYNRCTDILDLGSHFVFNLKHECIPKYIEHSKEFKDTERGVYVLLGFSNVQSTSFNAWFLIVCGEGNFVVTGTGVTDADSDTYDTITSLYETAEMVLDAASGANPGAAFLESFWEAVNAEDYRFEDHDGDGVWNVHDEDYKGAMSSNEPEWFTKQFREDSGDEESDGNETADDESGNDNNNSSEENQNSLHDGDGCPEDEWILC